MSRVWGTRTADERRAARRERLIRAAIKVYGEIGYRKATVKAVCATAGLTERYFYESFENGEDLLRRCFQTVEDVFLASMRKAGSREASVLERVRSGLLVYLDEIRREPVRARVFLIEMANVSPAAEAIISASLDRFSALLMEVLADDPKFERHPSPLLLRGIMGGGLHIIQAWVASGYVESIEAVADLNLHLYSLLMKPETGSRVKRITDARPGTSPA